MDSTVCCSKIFRGYIEISLSPQEANAAYPRYSTVDGIINSVNVILYAKASRPIWVSWEGKFKEDSLDYSNAWSSIVVHSFVNVIFSK